MTKRSLEMRVLYFGDSKQINIGGNQEPSIPIDKLIELFGFHEDDFIDAKISDNDEEILLNIAFQLIIEAQWTPITMDKEKMSITFIK